VVPEESRAVRAASQRENLSPADEALRPFLPRLALSAHAVRIKCKSGVNAVRTRLEYCLARSAHAVRAPTQTIQRIRGQRRQR
jgi:hypothetical protein